MTQFKFGITQAPSNIAIIKYMGKLNTGINLPENESLSLTLNGFSTFTFFKCEKTALEETEIFFNGAPVEDWLTRYCLEDSFFGSSKKNWIHPQLTEAEIEKTNNVLLKLKSKCKKILVENGFTCDDFQKIEMRTVNTFPASAGIASSASSQASLTVALFYALVNEKECFEVRFDEDIEFKKKIAALSREASGSSCRSFLGPWVKWSGESIQKVLPTEQTFSDILVLMSRSKKKVSSSQAHLNVKTSPLWEGRILRAQDRLLNFEYFFQKKDYKKCAEISYEEAMDMHELFHTSQPSFSYFETDTRGVLEWYRKQILNEAFPPFLTMDAGPNIHFITLDEDVEKWVQKIKSNFPNFEILVDTQGDGVRVDHIQKICEDDFSIEIPAKWVLSGEHSVLHGKPALTLPLADYFLKLKWTSEITDYLLHVQPKHHSELLEKLILQLKKIIPFEFQNKNFSGTLNLENTIPLQAGLGSSAALSVGLVEFLTRGQELKEELKLNWAMELENYFHGKSSGMDVAAVFYQKPLIFKKGKPVQMLEVKVFPHFTFHNTFETMSTLTCVEQVLAFESTHPQKAEALHQKMGDATKLTQEGLEFFQMNQKTQGEDLIARAMQMNLECFYDWGLISDGIHQKITELKKQNPLAIKLTGAGLGGFLVALWRS